MANKTLLQTTNFLLLLSMKCSLQKGLICTIGLSIFAFFLRPFVYIICIRVLYAYSVTHLYENIAIIRYKESFFQTKSIIQPPINILWATFSLCFNFLSGEPFGPDSQKYLIFREKMQFSKIRILNND